MNDSSLDKTLLLIAYYFPPAAVVGTHRAIRFVHSLPKFGWQTVVITINEGNYDLHDYGLCNKIPLSCTVYRTRILKKNHVKRIYGLTHSGGMLETGILDPDRSRNVRKLFRKLTSIPDTRIGWLPFAIYSSIKAIKRHNVDAILTTSYPYTAHIIGLFLKLFSGKTWIADFRDPWAEYAFLYPNTNFHRKVAANLEIKVIKKADVVVANTFAARDRLHSRYSKYKSKIIAIPNGFDATDFQKNGKDHINTGSSKFVITHAGTVFPEKSRRSPHIFLEAIADFLARYPNLRHHLQVRFVGHINYKVNLQLLVDQFGLGPNIIPVGYLSHQDTIHELLSAHILLLIHHSGSTIPKLLTTIPAKTYEYLGARKPILCLSSGGAVAELITHLQAGLIVEPQNHKAISAGVEELFFNYPNWQAKCAQQSAIDQFEASSLTRNLVTILNEKLMN